MLEIIFGLINFSSIKSNLIVSFKTNQIKKVESLSPIETCISIGNLEYCRLLNE